MSSGFLLALRSIDLLAGLSKAVTLLPDYYFGKGKSSSLINITMELTSRCNQQCVMCSGKITDPESGSAEELDLNTIKNVITQAKKIRAGFFLTGGEPFCRPDIMRIIAAIKQNGLKCGVNTNGTLLNEQKIDSLVSAGLDFIIFSVLGNQKVHDQIAGVPGSYNAMVENLKLFSRLNRNTTVLLNQPITAENFETLQDTVSLAKSADVDGVRFQHLDYVTKKDIDEFSVVKSKYFKKNDVPVLSKTYDHYDFPHKKAARVFQEVVNSAKENNVKIVFKPCLGENAISRWHDQGFVNNRKCIYPWVSMRIAANGDVFCCPRILYKIGNVKQDQVCNLINNSNFRRFRQALRSEKGRFDLCKRCCKLFVI